jgi:hypothetical protein
MIPRIALLAIPAAFATLGCLRTTELADWGGDSGPDGGLGDIIAMDCSDCPAVGKGLANLRCALDLCDPSYVLNGDGEYVAVTDYRSEMDQTCTVDDTREAIARFGDPDNDLAPLLNGSYAIMATGDWDAYPHSTSCSPVAEEDIGADSYETDDNSKLQDTIYDAVEWRLQLRAPPDAKSFSFDYVFFSTAYDEAITSPFNDKFYAEIEAGSTNGGAATPINFTACRDDDLYFDFECHTEDVLEQSCTAGVKYCYIAINSAYSECCWYGGCPDGIAETSIGGTGYECADSSTDDSSGNGSSTGWLHTAWPIDGGEEFTLTFHIHDTFDATRDSAVILDAFRFHRKFSSGGTIIIE